MSEDALRKILLTDPTEQQWQAVWTTYCLANDLLPDTQPYDQLLTELYLDYWCRGGVTYKGFAEFMGAMLY